jgi:hypothetical protein
VYGISCLRCGQQYVGQTKRPKCQRLQEHLRSIKNCLNKTKGSTSCVSVRPQPVGLHFSAQDHIGTRDLKIQVLDFVKAHPDSKQAGKCRLKVEKKWIHRLRCPAPYGMNIFD